MLAVVSAVVIAIIAVIVTLQRRHLADLQALLIGGSVAPGCVIAEAITLLLVAAAILAAHYAGLI